MMVPASVPPHAMKEMVDGRWLMVDGCNRIAIHAWEAGQSLPHFFRTLNIIKS